MEKTATNKITFPGANGVSLAARLDLPIGEPKAYALFAHCFTCSKDVFAAARISKALTEHGIAVLRFDFTGLGSSEGEFANTNFSSNVDDLLHAVNYLKKNHQAPKILIGHSLGGAAVLAAAPKVPEATAICTINAPSDPNHISHFFKQAIDEITEKGKVEVQLAGRPFVITKQFLDDVAKQNLVESIANLNKALLIFHSPADTTVPIDHARRIYEAAKHPKSFVSLHDADHLLTRRADAEYVAAVLAAWASRYLGEAEQAVEPETIEPGIVLVKDVDNGNFAQQVAVGKHRMRADEPVSYGGADTGPSPYDFLLSSLGACTSMTLRMYANHKKWPLDRVSVKLRHSKIHAEDCEGCETKDGKIDKIERVIHIEGDLDDKQRQRLLEVANRCPVHKTLLSEITIPTRLEE